MRKVLLATTALVAVTGVAHADVSINGYYDFGYASVSDDRTSDLDDMFNDHEIHISFSSTTDTGLTFGAETEIEATAANTGNDESSMYISGDFGKVVLGQNDDASYSFVTFPAYHNNNMGSNDVGSHAVNSAGTALTGARQFPQYARDGDNNKIAYFSPNFNGFKFGYSYGDEGTDNADTSVGVSYATEFSGVSVTATARMADSGESTDTTELTGYGLVLASGAMDFGVESGSMKSGTTVDARTTMYGIGYAVSDDLYLSANYVTSDNDVTNGDEFEASGVGFSYTIASGLNFAVGMTSFEATDGGSTSLNNDGTAIKSSLSMTF